jgi:parallel beta-helix repeat protein
MQPSFSGTLSITGSGTDGIYCTYAGPNVSVSGFTVDGYSDAVHLHTGCTITVENNLLRNSPVSGVHLSSTAAPTINNNVIVNNGAGGNNHGGMHANSTGTAYINNNFIRGNRADFGAGIMVRDSSPVIQNNLIVENYCDYANTYGGSGIFVYNNSSPTIINNTVAHNTSANTDIEGAGLHVGVSAGHTVTLSDNIIYGNTDANGANDIYWNGTGTLTEDFNLIGVHNISPPGENDVLGFDPLFTDGWYLNVAALDGGADSPAIDEGSVDAANTALGVGTVVLSATTTRTDGANEIDVNPIVDIGYHYPSNTVAASVNTTASTVSPSSYDEPNNTTTGGAQVVITITPVDSTSQILGPGLIVTTTQTNANSIGSVSDLGDGNYQVIYTIPGGTSLDTIGFVVNGITLDSTTIITWTQQP